MTLTTLDKKTKPVVPSLEDIQLAKESTKNIAQLNTEGTDHVAKLVIDNKRMEIKLSKSMFIALTELLEEMAAGRAVMLIPVDAELTTQEAADLLNVSRPYFVKLLDDGKIPCRTVGRYRRVRYEDLMKYQQLADAKRQTAMDSLVAQAQELGLGY
ncbi:MAG: helix-turn-helix domain-containing protein [Candidatus Obscuribacter sp.]|nr:helix-turn-helix domain-containing protein [Candidatus Obscuribacter sp.]